MHAVFLLEAGDLADNFYIPEVTDTEDDQHWK